MYDIENNPFLGFIQQRKEQVFRRIIKAFAPG